MSADLIDISEALEKRKFKEQDERIAKMREAFRVARTGSDRPPKAPFKGKGKRSGKSGSKRPD